MAQRRIPLALSTIIIGLSLSLSLTAWAANPYLVKDINTEPNSDYAWTTEALAINGLVFFAYMDTLHGTELWRSDGTVEGTYILMDINPGLDDSDPDLFTEYQDMLYFTADDGTNGQRLWRSDGTTEGTILVEGVVPCGDYLEPIPKPCSWENRIEMHAYFN